MNVLKAIQSIRRTDTEKQIAGVPGVASRVVARVFLGYLGQLLGCCYAVARVLGVVAKELLCGCSGTWVVARVLLGDPGWLLGCC